MFNNKKKLEKAPKKPIDAEMQKLVISRLSALSPSTMISLGSAGSFTRNQLMESVEEGNEVGEKIVEIEIEWLRSFKKKVTV